MRNDIETANGEKKIPQTPLVANELALCAVIARASSRELRNFLSTRRRPANYR